MQQVVLAGIPSCHCQGAQTSHKPSHVQSPVFAAKFSQPQFTMRSFPSTCRSALTDKSSFSCRLNDHQTSTYCLSILDGPCRPPICRPALIKSANRGPCALWSCSLYGTHTRAGGYKSRELSVRRNCRRQADYSATCLEIICR